MDSILKSVTLRNKQNNRFDMAIISIFFMLYLALPNYFAIEINDTLPLLTISRLLIIILFIYVVTKYKIDWRLKSIPVAIGVYFILVIFVNVIHFPDAFTDSVKRIFSIICEELLLIVLISYVIDTKEKVDTAIKWMLYALAIIVVFGALESFTGINVFLYLDSVQREMLQSEYIRLGFQRAAGPFGHSVYYGEYCVSMLPFSFYMLNKTKQPRYYTIIILNVLGVILSMARGAILVLCFGLLLLLILHGIKFSKRSFFVLLGVVVVGAIIVFAISPIRELFFGLVKSTFESLFGSASSDNFGDNASGFMSRFAQFSGVVWLAQNGSLLIGFGANCHMRNLVYYFQQGEWQNVRSFDVNYLADIIQYGIIGALGYLILYVYVLLFVFRRSRGYMTNTNCAFVLFYALYYAVLFASAGLGTTFWLVTGLMIAYNKVNPTIFIRDGKFKKVFYIKEHYIGNQLLLL